MEMMHEGQKIFNCDNCKMIFDQKYKLLDHTRGKDQCKPKDYKHLQKVTTTSTIKTKIVKAENSSQHHQPKVNRQEKFEEKGSVNNKCLTCDENFKSPGLLKNHCLRHGEHARMLLLKSKNPEIPKSSKKFLELKGLRCFRCKEYFENAESRDIHYENTHWTHHPKKIEVKNLKSQILEKVEKPISDLPKCNLRGIQFKSSKDQKIHNSKNHVGGVTCNKPEKQKSKCEICGNFFEMIDYWTHIVNIHGKELRILTEWEKKIFSVNTNRTIGIPPKFIQDLYTNYVSNSLRHYDLEDVIPLDMTLIQTEEDTPKNIPKNYKKIVNKQMISDVKILPNPTSTMLQKECVNSSKSFGQNVKATDEIIKLKNFELIECENSISDQNVNKQLIPDTNTTTSVQQHTVQNEFSSKHFESKLKVKEKEVKSFELIQCDNNNKSNQIVNKQLNTEAKIILPSEEQKKFIKNEEFFLPKCEQCGILFYNSQVFKNHINTVHGVKIHIEKNLSKQNNVNKPLMNHQAPKSMLEKCNFCQNFFKRTKVNSHVCEGALKYIMG